MAEKQTNDQKTTRGEHHGCIVCGKLYELYSVYDANGKFIDCKVMSAGGKRVPDPRRPLVACEGHTAAEIDEAVIRVYGKQKEEDD
jgi:succinate dehydrogenase/fumarate reductase-like Fe-S protein